jgi:hypothetical protein
LKSGLTSAPRLPHNLHVNRGSMSDNRALSSPWSAWIATEWLPMLAKIR